jgi:hypothetical protein
MKLTDRIKGDGLALLVWGVATCASCRAPAQSIPVPADGTRVAPGKPVVWDPFVHNAMQFQYEMVTNRAGFESALCLYGRNERRALYVDRAEFPFIKDASPHHVNLSCRRADDFLGIAHTHNHNHPYNVPCSHSPLDRRSFADAKFPLSVVYCGPAGMQSLTRRQ